MGNSRVSIGRFMSQIQVIQLLADWRYFVFAPKQQQVATCKNIWRWFQKKTFYKTKEQLFLFLCDVSIKNSISFHSSYMWQVSSQIIKRTLILRFLPQTHLWQTEIQSAIFAASITSQFNENGNVNKHPQFLIGENLLSNAVPKYFLWCSEAEQCHFHTITSQLE